MGSKSSSAPPPDPRLIDAQIRSMGIQEQQINRLLANSERLMPLQEESMRFGLDASRQAFADSRADREFALSRRGMLSGMQDRLVSDANSFNTEARREELAGQAMGDVNQAFSNARGQQARGLARMGVNPNDGRYAAMGNQLTTQQALAQASAANKVRQAARMEGMAMTDRATNALAGYPSMASGLSGASAGFGASGLNLANSGLAGMNAGFGAAGTMAGQMGQNATGMYTSMGNYKTGQDNVKGEMWGSILGAGATLGAAVISDRRMKTDIKRVGKDERTGLPLYEFAYKNGDGRRFRGVMADEVMQVQPKAVEFGKDGYARVNYAMLGLNMVEV